MKDRKEYLKAYRQAHKEEQKAYRQTHKEDLNAKCKEYYQAHKEEYRAYMQSDVNSLGQTKKSIRQKSRRYLNKYGTKIHDYQIHHCCTYTEPYKFIYCSKEMHLKIHQYLRDNNIDADSDHYKYIKHLLDDSVIKYNTDD